MTHNFHPTMLREYDIRGVVGDTLSDKDAYAIGRSFATLVARAGGKRIAVGYDGRLSSPMLCDALVAGINAARVDALNVGLGPTPMLYYAASTEEVDGGIQITGSHNPPDYNGFKIVMQGRPFYGADIQRIGEMAAAGDWEVGEGATQSVNIIDAYVDRLVEGVAEHRAHVRDDAAAGNGLAVISIAKSYDKRVVLSDVSLSVAKGEVLGLLGPNGAGKTTCFYSIMGLVKPDAGRIMLDGADITALPMYRRAILGLGYLPQETSIFRGMTVEQNISAVLELAEPDKIARERRLEELLEEFGLTRLRSAAAMALSGGERRRAEIARALAANPSIMLLDEPFAGIDPLSISDIRDLVADLKTRGIGVLITDHNVRETLDLVDRACIIYDGKVLLAGSPEELVADPEVRRLYLGEGFSL